ncbi:hypothetical protein B0H94_12032 [Salsuginibacillus halophilus]|uniref:Uncharacterized protein n=1 Tax=Salsuginibacillus halophilus TaxID=517424 RepID=A0A2P8H4Y5_9BACI|nr:hypothetical protein [Salsuginibacillus halophilus]PSL41286.1 hypothetical protein B0H94_12032 [Salsuginibacillus halophilus]
MTETYDGSPGYTEGELIHMAFRLATLTDPSEEMQEVLEKQGVEAAFQALLVLRQSPKRVRNVEGFLKKALVMGWGPSTVPVRRSRLEAPQMPQQRPPLQHPGYDWLEAD